jgi:hypothetical protein
LFLPIRATRKFQSVRKREFLPLSHRQSYYQTDRILSGRGWTAVKIGDWVKSEVEYGRDLADSGWQGARSAADSMLDGKPVGAVLGRSVRATWAPTVMGAGMGTLCALLAQRKKPKTSVAFAMGVVGGFVGFTAGLAWETRQLSSEIARGALRGIGSTRDSHWLGKHPINFG